MNIEVLPSPAREGYFAALPSRGENWSRDGFSREEKAQLYDERVPVAYAKAAKSLQADDIVVIHGDGIPVEYGLRLIQVGVWAKSVKFFHENGVPTDYVIALRSHYGPSQIIALHQGRVPVEYAVGCVYENSVTDTSLIVGLYRDGIPLEFATQLDTREQPPID